MALLSAKLERLGTPTQGKVREIYDLGDRLLLVTTDRISAFDVVMANGIPDKGRILNQLSSFWFNHFADIRNHVLSTADVDVAAILGESRTELSGRCTIARKAKPLPIECVARGYICGSLYKEFRAAGSDIHDLDLPKSLLDGSRLAEPIFTPATKASQGHDQNLSFREACDLVGRETAEHVRDLTIDIYRRAASHAAKAGLILADTKFEFGETEDGIIWIDEALTPDSSRYWEAASWEPGGAQPSFDKQFVRDYLEGIGWDKNPPGPELPDDVVSQTRAKYIEAFERLTGTTFAR